MSVEETRQVMEAYAASHDVEKIAPEAVFNDIASGQKFVGREAIAGMLHYVYNVGLDAVAENTRIVIGDGVAALEAEIVGTHIGEFAGVPATGLPVRIPLTVFYDVSDGYVQEGRVYLMASAFLQQVGAA